MAAAILNKRHPAGAARTALAWGLLVLGVAALHAYAVNEVGGLLAALRSPPDMPERLEVRYVREMAVAPAAAPSLPAPRRAALPAPAPRAAPRLPRAETPQPAETPASAPALEPDVESAAAPEAAASAASAPDQPEQAVASAANSAASAAPPASQASSSGAAPPGPALEPAPLAMDSVWPQSTRVRYAASGYYRGEISGNASVEWTRQGNRYQMHMDVRMGFLFQRRATSQGRIEAQGVVPERYDESTKVPFSGERRAALRFNAQDIELANGQRLPRPPGLQDTTSQFVQLTYLFTTQPELLQPGRSIEFPLAFPRRVRAYSYQVQEMQTMHTPFGPLQVLHVKPRRVEAKDRDMVAEAWFAPQLHYLPARIRISQDEETYIDLVIDKRPELAQ